MAINADKPNLPKHIYKEAYIAPKVIKYTFVDQSEIDKAKAHGLPTEFEALSVGTKDGQLCIVPLDESSREIATLLVRLWNNFNKPGGW